MGRVLAVVSQKGGVGKTTTAINVSAALAQLGVKTLLIDADPQGSVRYGLGLHTTGDGAGLSEYLAGERELHEIVRQTAFPWLRVVYPGLVSEQGHHEDYLRVFAESEGFGTLVGRAKERGYVIVVDTPPGLGPVVHRVLAASQRVLVPLQCEPLALQTSAQLLRAIREAITANPSLALEGILLTMVEAENPVSVRVADYVRAQMPPGLVLDVQIPRTAASSEAFAAGQPVVARSPEDRAARAYAALGERFRDRLS